MAGFVLLIGSYALPTKNIKNNINKEIEQLNKETNSFSAFGKSVKSTSQDNYTEAIYLSQASIGGEYNDLIENTLNGFAFINNSIESLTKYLNGNNDVEITGLIKFWNGWLIVLKPMLIFMTYSQIRYVNFVVQSLLLFAIMLLFRKKNMKELQMPFLLTCLFMSPVTLGLSMAFAGFYYQILISMIVMLLFNDQMINRKLYSLFFMLLGIMAFYFNMNYFQLCTIGFPLVLYFYMNKIESIKIMILKVIEFGALWLFGYFGMMIGKWALYALFYDTNIFIETLNNIVYRTGVNFEHPAYLTPRIAAVLYNFVYILDNKILIILNLIYVIYAILKIKKNKLFNACEFKRDFVFVIVTIVIVLLRYYLEANHSYIHSFAVYRNLAICVFAINAFLAKYSTKYKCLEEKNK